MEFLEVEILNIIETQVFCKDLKSDLHYKLDKNLILSDLKVGEHKGLYISNMELIDSLIEQEEVN